MHYVSSTDSVHCVRVYACVRACLYVCARMYACVCVCLPKQAAKGCQGRDPAMLTSGFSTAALLCPDNVVNALHTRTHTHTHTKCTLTCTWSAGRGHPHIHVGAAPAVQRAIRAQQAGPAGAHVPELWPAHLGTYCTQGAAVRGRGMAQASSSRWACVAACDQLKPQGACQLVEGGRSAAAPRPSPPSAPPGSSGAGIYAQELPRADRVCKHRPLTR